MKKVLLASAALAVMTFAATFLNSPVQAGDVCRYSKSIFGSVVGNACGKGSDVVTPTLKQFYPTGGRIIGGIYGGSAGSAAGECAGQNINQAFAHRETSNCMNPGPQQASVQPFGQSQSDQSVQNSSDQAQLGQSPPMGNACRTAVGISVGALNPLGAPCFVSTANSVDHGVVILVQ